EGEKLCPPPVPTFLPRALLALDPKTRILPGGPVAAQINDSLPTADAERRGGDIGPRAATTVENQFVGGAPRKIARVGKQCRNRNVYGTRHVACGKLALG